MNIRWRVELRQDEREELTALLKSSRHAVRKVKRAQILLAADDGVGDGEVAARVGAGGLDPSRKSGGALHRLHCFCLEFDGACEVQRRVPTDWIIEPIDVSGYGSFSLAS